MRAQEDGFLQAVTIQNHDLKRANWDFVYETNCPGYPKEGLKIYRSTSARNVAGVPFRKLASIVWFERKGQTNFLNFATTDVSNLEHNSRNQSSLKIQEWDTNLVMSAMLAVWIPWLCCNAELHCWMGKHLNPKSLQQRSFRCIKNQCAYLGTDSYTVRDMPAAAMNGVLLLEQKYREFNGIDIRESMEKCREQFKFLVGRHVSFEDVKTAWDETVTASVLES